MHRCFHAFGCVLFIFTPSILRKQILTNIYVLNSTGTSFDLKDSHELQPYECFMTASKSTQATVKSLSINGGGGVGNVSVTDGFSVYAAHGVVCSHVEQTTDIAIYTSTGQLIKQLPAFRGDTSITLPAGIYMIRCNGKTIKVNNLSK